MTRIKDPLYSIKIDICRKSMSNTTFQRAKQQENSQAQLLYNKGRDHANPEIKIKCQKAMYQENTDNYEFPKKKIPGTSRK